MSHPVAVERLFELQPVRWAVALLYLARARLRWTLGRRYRAIEDFCWVARVSGIPLLRRVAEKRVHQIADTVRTTGKNPLLDWYLDDVESRRVAESYAIVGSGRRDVFRDLLVLKEWQPGEKGVIVLKYARTFHAVAAIFEMRRLMERYTFVLEPCWTGYCDPALLLFLSAHGPVIVQCFTEQDHEFVSRLGAPLVPVRLGPADWVDASVFDIDTSRPRSTDLVMVANWGRHKRHAKLFEALSRIKDRDIRVLLVGFAWAGRTAADVKREAARWASPNIDIEFAENLSHAELAARLTDCKVFVFLTRKEGDNKALVEALFCGVPAIVYRETVGGASSRINDSTGILSSDEELTDKVVYMLDHYREFKPRQWALENTGSGVATRVLDDAIRNAVSGAGDLYSTGIVEKRNAPNLAYKDDDVRALFESDYEFVKDCVRPFRAPARQDSPIARHPSSRS